MSVAVTNTLVCNAQTDRNGGECGAEWPVSVGQTVADAREQAHYEGWSSMFGTVDLCPVHKGRATVSSLRLVDDDD